MKSLLHKIKNGIRIKLAAIKLFVQAFFWLTLVRLGLRFLSFAQLQAKVDRLAQKTVRSPGYYTLYGLTWSVDRAAKVMPGGAKCLAKAMTTQILMGQNGYPYDLCIGVLKGEAGELQAHAWIESEQKIVMGWLPEIDRYKRLEKQFYQGMARSL